MSFWGDLRIIRLTLRVWGFSRTNFIQSLFPLDSKLESLPLPSSVIKNWSNGRSKLQIQ